MRTGWRWRLGGGWGHGKGANVGGWVAGGGAAIVGFVRVRKDT